MTVSLFPTAVTRDLPERCSHTCFVQERRSIPKTFLSPELNLAHWHVWKFTSSRNLIFFVVVFFQDKGQKDWGKADGVHIRTRFVFEQLAHTDLERRKKYQDYTFWFLIWVWKREKQGWKGTKASWENYFGHKSLFSFLYQVLYNNCSFIMIVIL